MIASNDDPGYPIKGPKFWAFKANCALMQTDHILLRYLPKPANKQFRVWATPIKVVCFIHGPR